MAGSGSQVAAPEFLAAFFLSFTRVRIAPSAKLDCHGRADELELAPEVALEVALVGVGDAVEGVAMNDDARGVDAALMGVAELGADDAGLWRGLLLDGGDQGAGELGGGEAGHGGGVGGVDGAHQDAHALALLRGDGVALGVAEEAELPLELGLYAVALFLGRGVPLVDGEDQRAAALEDVAGDVGVLLGDAVDCI